MNCSHCSSSNTARMKATTKLGYNQYRYQICKRQFNERTGTQLNHIEYPTEIVMLVIHYYYRFKVSLDDVVELMAMRHISLSHQSVHNWVQTFGIELGLKLRARRKGKCGIPSGAQVKWHADATYLCIIPRGHRQVIGITCLCPLGISSH